MLKRDRDMLISLVKEYNMQEIIATLVEVTNEQADEYSDLGLKEKARDMMESADLLREIYDVI